MYFCHARFQLPQRIGTPTSGWSAVASVGIGLATGLALSFGLGKVITRWVQNGVHV
jgi:hypothetical protein